MSDERQQKGSAERRKTTYSERAEADNQEFWETAAARARINDAKGLEECVMRAWEQFREYALEIFPEMDEYGYVVEGTGKAERLVNCFCPVIEFAVATVRQNRPKESLPEAVLNLAQTIAHPNVWTTHPWRAGELLGYIDGKPGRPDFMNPLWAEIAKQLGIANVQSNKQPPTVADIQGALNAGERKRAVELWQNIRKQAGKLHSKKALADEAEQHRSELNKWENGNLPNRCKADLDIRRALLNP